MPRDYTSFIEGLRREKAEYPERADSIDKQIAWAESQPKPAASREEPERVVDRREQYIAGLEKELGRTTNREAVEQEIRRAKAELRSESPSRATAKPRAERAIRSAEAE